MRFTIRHVLGYAPAVVLALVMGFVVVNWGLPDSKSAEPTPIAVVLLTPVPTPVPYAPLAIKDFTLLTPAPYHVGQVISLRNGLCNTSNQTIAITITLGIHEDVDPVRARNVALLPQPGSPGMLTLKPGCISDIEPLVGPLPTEVGPGTWHISLIVTAIGSEVNQRQTLPIETKSFEVIP